MSHPAANWKCKCGRGPSIDHGVGEYCSGRIVIENLEHQLALAREGLHKIDGGFCEGNEPGDHGKCEEWMRDVARLTLAALAQAKPS
jgi:hypothetical protein